MELKIEKIKKRELFAFYLLKFWEFPLPSWHGPCSVLKGLVGVVQSFEIFIFVEAGVVGGVGVTMNDSRSGWYDRPVLELVPSVETYWEPPHPTLAQGLGLVSPRLTPCWGWWGWS